MMTPPPSEKATAGEREYLNSPEEILYMQVFVEEVGVWMDSLDKEKHFSRLIPYHALKSPMLLNAFLACGVKHLTLVNPAYQDDKALFYYDTATTQLLRSLQNPDRNTGECATTAVVLNVYEIMSEKPAQRMNHIAGARALIRECKWDARSSGIGAACFWLNIGMEVLSCLAFNWQTSWDPDSWGLDMDFAAESNGAGAATAAAAASGAGFGSEELWVHRILYIVAKIANFRATIPRFQEPSPHDEQIRLGNRLAQWQDLKRLCDKWNNACPRTMHPFGYLYPSQTNSKSAFPNVWCVFLTLPPLTTPCTNTISPPPPPQANQTRRHHRPPLLPHRPMPPRADQPHGTRQGLRGNARPPAAPRPPGLRHCRAHERPRRRLRRHPLPRHRLRRAHRPARAGGGPRDPRQDPRRLRLAPRQDPLRAQEDVGLALARGREHACDGAPGSQRRKRREVLREQHERWWCSACDDGSEQPAARGADEGAREPAQLRGLFAAESPVPELVRAAEPEQLVQLADFPLIASEFTLLLIFLFQPIFT